MPLNLGSLLHTPSPVQKLDLTGMFGSPGKGLERQRLELMKKEFEETKRRHAEDERLRREAEAGDMARARLAAEADKAAKLQEDRLKTFGEFTKQSGEGNAEAMRSMVPLMHSLGMDVELEGEVDGLPRYRVGMDAAEAQRQEGARAAQTSSYGEGETAEQSLSRLGAMGLGGETGSLQPPLGIRSSDEVDPASGQSVADRVAATYGMPGEKTATAGPDTPDFTGGVPKNVIDMGASAAATLHRLDPALKGMVAAYPDEQTRAGAEEIRQGLRSSGLPLEKQMAAFDKGISGPASQRNAQIGAQAQADRFRETRDELTEKDIAGLQQQGRQDADGFAKDNKIVEIGRAFDAGNTILDVIDDPSPDNDAMIASELMTFQNVKGTPSDTDLKMAFGIPMSSTIDQALTEIRRMVMGGMQQPQREAIKAYMAAKQNELKGAAFDYLDQAHARAEGGAYNERAKKAYLQTIKGSTKGWIYNDWLDMKKKRDEGSAGDRGKSGAELSDPGARFDPNPISGDFDIELESLAMENDLDPEKIAPLIKHESGGKADAKSSAGASGVLQIMPNHLKKMGIEPEDFRKLSATEQLPYVMRFFKDNGITSESSADDYALAVGASDPKWRGMPDSTVIYPKGSKAWEQNPAWRPADGGDITKESMLRFYGLRGKGAAAKLPEPKSALDKSVADILRRAGQ